MGSSVLIFNLSPSDSELRAPFLNYVECQDLQLNLPVGDGEPIVLSRAVGSSIPNAPADRAAGESK